MPTGSNAIDAEYLKNSILKMYRTGEAEALLPVFATILSFSKVGAGAGCVREGVMALTMPSGMGARGVLAAGVFDTALNNYNGHGACGWLVRVQGRCAGHVSTEHTWTTPH